MNHSKTTTIQLMMPRLGETMDQGTIIEWLVDSGKIFKRGDAILEVETDKTVVEFPALGDGEMLETMASPGDIVDVGAAIAKIKVTNPKEWENTETEPEPEPLVEKNTACQSPTPLPADNTLTRDETSRIRATPPARLFAQQQNLPLNTIAGTGRRGRIELSDVFSAQSSNPKTFLLIHGFAGDASIWVQLEANLKRLGHKAYTLDLPGHGNNASDQPTTESLINSALTIARTLPGKFHIVGHSLGAWVATNIAADADLNVASLTLITPMGTGKDISKNFIYGMANVHTLDVLKDLLSQLSPKTETLSHEALTQMLKNLSTGQLKALAQSLVDERGQTIDILQTLSTLIKSIPVMAIIGTKDQIIPPATAQNLPPHVRVHFLNTGHMPQWDAPSETTNLIIELSSTHTTQLNALIT